MKTEYAVMKEEELALCADLAAESFFDYEYFTNYIPDDKRRRKFLHRLLKVDITLNRTRGIYFTAKRDGELVAVAMLCPPGYHVPSDFEYIKGGFVPLYLIGGVGNVSAWLDMQNKAGEPCHGITDPQVWYLNMLTVKPEAIGTGVGSEMIRNFLIPYVAEQGGTAMTLFTNSESNCEFYKKRGFYEFDERFFEYKGKKLGSWSYRIDW